jgi:methyl-accepting chemotaxis protein
MDQVTQTNSAQTEELAATSQTLAGHATEMLAMVGRFRLGTETAEAAPRAPKPPAAKPATRAVKSLANLSRRTAPAKTPEPVASVFEEF